MNSPNTPCSMTTHQAIMKCPWQWRQPFLDEKLESRKRKVGDGYFYDPVDPSFVDHLLPGYAKKFCAELLESDEKEKIQEEIQRLMTKKEEDAMASPAIVYDSLLFRDIDDQDDGFLSASDDEARSDVNKENLALVDSILLMTQAVEESSLLQSPKSVTSSPYFGADADEEDTNSSSDESYDSPVTYERASSLQLVSDNLHDNYFASEDSDLLDFPTSCNPSSSAEDASDEDNSV